MKLLTVYKRIFSAIVLTMVAPAISLAQPAGPGDGSDPFATPVNGYIAFVAVIAFIYGAYRIYHITKNNRAGNTNR